MKQYYTGTFSKDFFSQGAVRYFYVFFISFCTNSIVKYGRNFILVLSNHIAPIFYYGISTKTNEKDLKNT